MSSFEQRAAQTGVIHTCHERRSWGGALAAAGGRWAVFVIFLQKK